jgi:hypothetical protein
MIPMAGSYEKTRKFRNKKLLRRAQAVGFIAQGQPIRKRMMTIEIGQAAKEREATPVVAVDQIRLKISGSVWHPPLPIDSASQNRYNASTK